MSILEILEAHDDYGFDPVGDSMRQVCMCGTDCGQATRNPDGVHRAHVAQVLEQHEREVMAAAYESAAERLHEEAASQQDLNRRNGRSEFLHAAVRMTVMEHEMRRSSAQFRATS